MTSRISTGFGPAARSGATASGPAAPAPGQAFVFNTMGTTASFRGPAVAADILAGVVGLFDAADRRFSLYRADSELSRINTGQITLPNASVAMKEMYELALDWRTRTGGHFTPHHPGGGLDLNGVVKAHTITAADALLRAEGQRNWCLNVGGDILADGVMPDGGLWRIGVTDPFRTKALLTQVSITPRRRAVATSGTLERGNHLWDGRNSEAPHGFLQATVTAPDIITADVLATTLAAAGPSVITDLLSEAAVDFIAVDASERFYLSAAFRQDPSDV